MSAAPVRLRTRAACPLCGGALAPRYSAIPDRLGTSAGGYTLVECADCGLGLINPAPTGDLSAFYPERYLSQEEGGSGLLSELERRYRSDQYRFDFGLLAETGVEIATAASYLDVGCGSGERVEYAADQGCRRAVGIDRYDFGKAAPRDRVSLIGTEITDFRPGDLFEVVSLFHVLEHVEEPVEVLRHLREHVIASDGTLIAQVPNYGSVERRFFGRRWNGLDAPRHLFQFNAATAREVAERAGFEVVAVAARNATWHPVTLVPSLFPSLDVQRIWIEGGPAPRRILRQALWAACTLALAPLNWLQSRFGTGSMLTLVARPRL